MIVHRRRQWHPTPVLLPGKSHGWRSLVGTVHEVATSRTRMNNFNFTFHFHALEKEMATRSSVPAWRIPGTGEPGGLPSMGSHRVGHDWSDLAAWSCIHIQRAYKFLIKVLGYKAGSSSPVWNVILTCTDHSTTSPADCIPLRSFSLRVSRHGSNCYLLCEKNIQTICTISRGILQWQEDNLLPQF